MSWLVHNLVPGRNDSDKTNENTEETKDVRPGDVPRVKEVPNKWHPGEDLRKVHRKLPERGACSLSIVFTSLSLKMVKIRLLLTSQLVVTIFVCPVMLVLMAVGADGCGCSCTSFPFRTITIAVCVLAAVSRAICAALANALGAFCMSSSLRCETGMFMVQALLKELDCHHYYHIVAKSLPHVDRWSEGFLVP